MNTFTTTPLSVKSITVDGYKPNTSIVAHTATVAEIVANSPSLIWGPVPVKQEVGVIYFNDGTEDGIVTQEQFDSLFPGDRVSTPKKETIVDKLLKFASRHAPEIVEVMMRDHKK